MQSSSRGMSRIFFKPLDFAHFEIRTMVCYICMADEEDATAELLTDLCACTDRAVHAACLVRWIEQSGHTRCGACKQELNGVSVIKRVRRQARAKQLACLWASLAGVATPMYFTSSLVRDAVRAGRGGSLAVSIFLLLYELGFCAVILLTWLKTRVPVVHRVHVELPELRV